MHMRIRPIQSSLRYCGSRRIAQEVPDQGRGDDADRNVDEENPVPVPVVRNPAADHRTERGPDDHAHRKNALRLPLLLNAVGVAQDRLRGCDQAAAAQALNQPPKNQLSEAVRETAHQRGDGKDDDRGKEVLTPSEARGEPRIERNHDDVGDEVRRNDPGAQDRPRRRSCLECSAARR